MNVTRLIRTARHLEPGQIGWRALHELRLRAYRRWPHASQIAWRAATHGRAPAAAVLLAEVDPALLGRERRIAQRWNDGDVEYLGVHGHRFDWGGSGRPRLWRYERHYHSELVSLAAMAAAEPGGSWAHDARELIESWHAAAPISFGDGWEPYPVARRILNWSLSMALLPSLADLLAPALAVHLRFLRTHLERHLLGNHLLCNASALMTGGALLDAAEFERIARSGEAILGDSLRRQVLADGGYAERTLQYHCVVLRDVLLAIGLTRLRGRGVDPALAALAARMAEWLRQVRRESLAGPWLNDAAPDACPPLDEVLSLAAALGVGAAPKLGWLGAAFGGHALAAEGSLGDVALVPTGWSFVREGGHELLFDHGPIGPDEQPGHGHSDALAYELIWDGVPVVTDTGVTTYDRGAVRDHERSARAHATVSADGEGPDEIWASFRVGGRARVAGGLNAKTPEGVRVLSGRTRAWSGWEHHRQVVYWPGEALVVLDRVSGARGTILSHVPFDPECRVENGGIQTPAGPLQWLVLRGTAGPSVSGRSQPREGWVGEGFGRARPRPSIAVHADGQGRVAYAIAAPGRSVVLDGDACRVRGPRGEVRVTVEGSP